MAYEKISFQVIDFRQPDGEFVYKGKTYQIKQYINKYFFKAKNYHSYDFIYSFKESGLAKSLCEKDCFSAYIEESFPQWAEYIERCVEYEQTIFCFSVNQEKHFERRGGEGRYFDQISGKGVHFSRQYEVWIFVGWKPPKCLNLDEMLELPHEFFLQQAIAACNRGLLAAFSFQAIDFSQPDCEFSFQGETYQVKRYSDKYFFRNKFDKGYDFIYSCEYSYFLEEICQQQQTTEAPPQLDLERQARIQRCIEYAGTIFCFSHGYGFWDSGFERNEDGEYCSFKSRYWIPIRWKPGRELNLDDILKQPKEFFIEQAHTAQLLCVLEIDEEEIHPALRAAYKFEGAKPLGFVRGCEAELKQVTRLAAYSLPELQPLFERYSSLKVVYISDEEPDGGGFNGVYTGEPTNWRNWFNKAKFSRQARLLFQLIYEYNLFTGSGQEPRGGGAGVIVYESYPLSITVEVEAPSQQEKLEAALELQTWLADKVAKSEINAYLEANHELDLPDVMDEHQLDNEKQQLDVDDIPF